MLESSGSRMRDLCLHAVPCEVYQVLLKYMALMTAQRDSHRECCGCGQTSQTGAPGQAYKTANENEPRDSDKLEAAHKVSDKETVVHRASGSKTHKDSKLLSEAVEREETAESTTEENKEPMEEESEGEVIVPDSEVIPNSYPTEDILSMLPLPGIDVSCSGVSADVETVESKVVSKSRVPEAVKDKLQTKHSRDDEQAGKLRTEDACGAGKLRTLEDHGAGKSRTVDLGRGKSRTVGDLGGGKSRTVEDLGVGKSGTVEDFGTYAIHSEEVMRDKLALDSLNTDGKGSLVDQMEDDGESQMSGSLLASMDEKIQTSNNKKLCMSDNATKPADKFEKSLNQRLRDKTQVQKTEVEELVEKQKLKEKTQVQKTEVEELVEKQKLKERTQVQKTDVEEPVEKQKLREKTQVQKTDVEELVEVEKENLKNSGNLQPAFSRLRRKPLQSGQPVLENIMSQVITDGKNSVIDKVEVVQSQEHISQDGLKTFNSQNKPTASKQILSTELSSRTGKKHGMENLVIGHCHTEDDSESSSECSSLKTVSNSIKRKYRRISKPASSGSSSEDSDSEVISNPHKRRAKAIPSSNSSPPSSVRESQKDKLEDPELHDLDSEEMRNLERMDLNVWEVFGHPDKDLTKQCDDDRDSVVTIEDSQKDKDMMMVFDDPPPVTLSGTSDEEIPSTAEALRNVNMDMDIIKKSREKARSGNLGTKQSSEDSSKRSSSPVSDNSIKIRNSQNAPDIKNSGGESARDSSSIKTSNSEKTRGSSKVVTRSEAAATRSETMTSSGATVSGASQVSMHTSSVAPTFSVDTRKLFTKVDRSLSMAEMLLDADNDIFEDLCTPQEVEATNKHSTESTKGRKEKVNEDVSVVNNSDEETSDGMETASHSSAFSSQSEAVSTQKRQQVKDEVEQLRARVRELEAEMKKNTNKEDCEKPVTEPEELPPTCPSADSDNDSDEIFSSLPDLNMSELPSVLSHAEEKPSPPKPRAVRYKTNGPPQLVCTGLNSTEMRKVQDMIKNIGLSGLSIKRSFAPDTTHVVVKTDKERLAQRTLKYLFGVAAGCWVLDVQWVIDSLTAKKLMPELEYEVFDCTGITGPRRGRMSPSKLFGDYEFFLQPPFGDISCDQLKELVELCGAKVKESPTRFSGDPKRTKLVIMDTEGNHDADEIKAKYKQLAVAHDWILECVGMYAHICITPYIIGNPSHDHFVTSCLPMLLLQETQEL